MKKFAFILMGPNYDPAIHTAEFNPGGSATFIYTVRNFEEAKARVLSCAADGFGVIELCGAFGEQKAREFIELTDGKVGIGFVEHLPEQDSIFDSFFGRG